MGDKEVVQVVEVIADMEIKFCGGLNSGFRCPYQE